MRAADWFQKRHQINRRAFLRGTIAGGAGVAVGLPFLEGLPGRSAFAQSAQPVFAFFICTANGVVQAAGGEPERFWPTAMGELTTAGMQGFAEERCTGILADHASRLLIVRGIDYPYGSNGCGHSIGLTQALTSSRNTGTDNNAVASGVSADVQLYEAVNPAGVEGLNLYSGMKGGFINEKLSFKAGGNVRSAEGNPRTVYDRLIDGAVLNDGTMPTPTEPGGPSVSDLLALRRNSVNDIVRDELGSLLANTRLSTEDRRRIDQHLTGIRDVEVTMTEMEEQASAALSCTTSGLDVDGIQNLGNAYTQDGTIEDVARLHFDVVTLAFACGLNRVAAIQIGDGTDGTHYNVGGAQAERFHHISHRIRGDGSSGPAIAGAVDMHAAIDRLRMETFKYLLDRWAEYSTPNGPMFDNAFAMWTSHVATGPGHGFSNLPILIAGNAGGYLKNGAYVDGDSTNNRLFNTLLTAAGAPTESFGGSELSGGTISEMIA